MKIIGTNRINYPQIRNFLHLDLLDYKYKKSINFYNILSHFNSRFCNEKNLFYWNSFNDFDLSNVDFFHFFNTINFSPKPWLTHFEETLPKWGNQNDTLYLKGFKAIVNRNCKKIIAISENSFHQQKHFILEKDKYFFDEIINKMIILHPPQIIEDLNVENNISDEIVFTFIGNDFFRKGGLEFLKSVDIVTSYGYKNWKINLISNFKFGEIQTKSSIIELEQAQKIIKKYKNKISIYSSIPNKKVLEIIKKTNIGVLPTLWDSYGYSVLEFQSCACPVISTNIQALPEINNSVVGWIIELPKNEFGLLDLSSIAKLDKIKLQILDNLILILISIFNNPSSIKLKGSKAVERIKNKHDLAKYTKAINLIYNEIM